MFALPQRLDDHASAVCHADYSFGHWQALGVADGDVCIRRAEHANYPLRVLLSPLSHCEGSRRAGVVDWPCVGVWDVCGRDGVSLPCGLWRLLLVGAPDQCGGGGGILVPASSGWR